MKGVLTVLVVQRGERVMINICGKDVVNENIKED